MREPVTLYHVKCDGCGIMMRLPDSGGYVYEFDPPTVDLMITESHWTTVDGKDFCEGCMDYGDDDE